MGEWRDTGSVWLECLITRRAPNCTGWCDCTDRTLTMTTHFAHFVRGSKTSSTPTSKMASKMEGTPIGQRGTASQPFERRQTKHCTSPNAPEDSSLKRALPSWTALEEGWPWQYRAIIFAHVICKMVMVHGLAPEACTKELSQRHDTVSSETLLPSYTQFERCFAEECPNTGHRATYCNLRCRLLTGKIPKP